MLGAAEHDVEVNLDGVEFTLAGDIRREQNDEKSGCRVAERHVGSFRLIIQWPFELGPRKVEAQFQKELLT